MGLDLGENKPKAHAHATPELIHTTVTIESPAVVKTLTKKDRSGTYDAAVITYRNKKGELKEKAIHANYLRHNVVLKGKLEDLKTGDTVSLVLDKANMFSLKDIETDLSKVPKFGGSSTGTSGSTYTPDPTREARISSAGVVQAATIALGHAGKKITLDAILDLARLELEAIDTLVNDKKGNVETSSEKNDDDDEDVI